MKTSTFFLFLLFLSFGLMGQSRQDKIDSFVREQIKSHNIPALSYAIIDNGEVKLKGVYGMAIPEHGIANSDTTAFQLASATKLLTASAFMTLVEEGKIDLNQRVRHYLPQLPPQWDSMQVLDLLAHQSGIADLLGMKFHFNSVDEAMDKAMELPLDFEPGTKTVYAGGDYAVVAKLIESVSGLEFPDFLEQRLFRPLGMEHSGFNNMKQDYIYRTQDPMPYATTVYEWDEKRKKQLIFSMLFPSWTYPSGGLFASLDDLTKWVVAIDNGSLLSPEFTESMWTPAKLRNGTKSDFGVGWIVADYKGEKATGHSGGPALADIVRLPQRKITAIVLTNQVALRPFLTMKVLDLYMEGEQGSTHQ